MTGQLAGTVVVHCPDDNLVAVGTYHCLVNATTWWRSGARDFPGLGGLGVGVGVGGKDFIRAEGTGERSE